MAKWKIEGLAVCRDCYPSARRDALMVAATQSQEVKVEYMGPRNGKGNREPAMSNFVARPDGSVDFKVDPTWYENKS